MVDIEYAKKCFAHIVASDYNQVHDGMSWALAAGIGDEEERWENFQQWFERVFGITWEEALSFQV